MDLSKYISRFKNLVNKNSFLSKFLSLPKKRIIILAFILLSIPLTVALSMQQQIFEKNASTGEGTEVLAVNETSLTEDYVPDDNVASIPVSEAKVLYDTSMNSVVTSVPSVKATTTKPNIVVIMLDDVNPIDGRFFTQTRMPAVFNNIISKGINFNNYYGETSLCCPGRIGFLTGQHTTNHGVGNLDGTKFKPGTTIATELQAKGYYTMLTGKYINAFSSIPKSKAIPPGWTKFDAIYEGQGRYYRYNWITKKSGTAGTIKYYGESPSDYSTDVISRASVQRLKEAPANKPIFAYINPYSIHGPRTVAQRYIDDPRCKYIQPWKAPNVFEQDVSDKSSFFNDLPAGNPDKGYSLQRDCEVLLATDDLVRHVKEELSRQGRLNNTVFILTADNGYGFGEHRIPAKTAPYTTHIPLYIAWPDGRGTSSRSDNTVLSNIDVSATLCELAGCVMGPYPNGQTKSDGVSFLSLIKNQPIDYTRHSILESQPVKPIGADGYNRPNWFAVRTTSQNPNGLWHYIEYATGEKELYDLSNGPCYTWTPSKGGDPCELNNILRKGATLTAGQNTLVSQLKTELVALKKQKGFSSPTPTPTPTDSPTPTPEDPTPTPEETPTPTLSGATESVTINLTAKADSYIRSDSTNSNYGTSTTLNSKASNPISVAYFKFTLPNLTGKTIEKAVLKISTTNTESSSVGSLNKLAVKSISNSWTESNLKYSSRLTPGTTHGTKNGSILNNTTFEIDITSGLAGKTSGDISFILESVGSNENNLNIKSRESSSGKPTLVITYK